MTFIYVHQTFFYMGRIFFVFCILSYDFILYAYFTYAVSASSITDVTKLKNILFIKRVYCYFDFMPFFERLRFHNVVQQHIEGMMGCVVIILQHWKNLENRLLFLEVDDTSIGCWVICDSQCTFWWFFSHWRRPHRTRVDRRLQHHKIEKRTKQIDLHIKHWRNQGRGVRFRPLPPFLACLELSMYENSYRATPHSISPENYRRTSKLFTNLTFRFWERRRANHVKSSWIRHCRSIQCKFLGCSHAIEITHGKSLNLMHSPRSHI